MSGLAIIGVLTSVVSVFFLLAYRRDDVTSTPTDRPVDVSPVPRVVSLALVVSAVLVVYLGILPTRVLELAAASIRTILSE